MRLRRLSAALGLGAVAFGLAPAIAPRFFARLAGVVADDATSATAVRSVGVRDAVIGMGLWSAATHGGNYAPWLLARWLSDAGDTAAVTLAVARGNGDARFRLLGVIATVAAASGVTLWLAAREQRSAIADV